MSRTVMSWSLLVMTGILFLSAYSLEEYLEKKRSPQKVSKRYSQQITNAKIDLSKESKTLTEDQSFTDSVARNHLNTYTSRLTALMRAGHISHVGLYNKNCGIIFQTSSNRKSSNNCRHKKVNQLYWIKTQSASILNITRSLPNGNLLTISQQIDRSWVNTSIGNLEQFDLTLTYPKYKVILIN